MASPQVEIVSLRSTFGCVLRDRNQRNNNDDVVFKKNLKSQVKTSPSVISDENSQNRVCSWIGNKPRNNNKSRLGSPEKPRSRKENNFSGSEKRRDNLGGASSLVQIWEARLIRSNGGNSPIHGQSTQSSSVPSVQEIDLSAPGSESENESKNPDQTVEIKYEIFSTVSDSGDSKWGRVAEMIRRLSNVQKLTAGNKGGAVDNKPIIETSTPEKYSFPLVTNFPRLRGRQAYSDLLLRLERDRHNELESLLERNAVSRFPQRGRLQSMLRLRSLKRGLAIQDRHRGSMKGNVNLFEPGSTVLHLREKIRENVATEAERRKGQQSTIETESMRSKEISTLQETSSTERLSSQNSMIEDAILRKKDTVSKMSYLPLKETIVTEPRILKNEEAEQVETPFLEKEELLFANEWEDQDEYEDEQSYYGDMSYDWFTEISRPRTYWEDLRKSRYLEVMNTRSDKDDICRLLERRTVSGFLQSGLRETIDKLIMARVKTHSVQLKTHLRIEEGAIKEEKCDIGEEADGNRDDLSQTSSQIFLPSPAGSWSSQYTGVTSTPVHSLQSTEMEMISDLRSQILQLQLEMSELQNSVKTCLDVKASLQKSAHGENPLKRKCCVCNETQVETLLYRCGHMCTCLRCANELQCNGGKCPVCRAKILDVVRVFVDSRTRN